MASENPPEFLLSRAQFPSWDSDYVSWSIGMLTQNWLFVCLQCVIHMGEETKNPKRTVPHAMF
ncbi:hypothetical protein Micbo1qcDRAFT_200063 [Microdochium bolleyi]|uniref:Uncharacterized protein n=1 Tax=Microdochium bolleyi TaxID=196109 RepID=A0A136JJQ6_9PEZI|nr:hypothetical protein Micbo1qcDRAFT_200063 [Microdochium bolleyi]